MSPIRLQCESKNVPPRFLAIVPRRLRIKKYIHPLSVYINAILQNFIELSLTMTKLFHIKRDHLVTFYISLEKNVNTATSLQQYDRSPKNLAR